MSNPNEFPVLPPKSKKAKPIDLANIKWGWDMTPAREGVVQLNQRRRMTRRKCMTCSDTYGRKEALNPKGRLLKPYHLFCSSKCEEDYINVVGLTPYPLQEAYRKLLGAYERLKSKDKDEKG